MSWVTPLFVPGESASVLAEGLLCHCGQGLLSCYSIELLSNCSGELGVPLELWQDTQGFSRVAAGDSELLSSWGGTLGIPSVLRWGTLSLSPVGGTEFLSICSGASSHVVLRQLVSSRDVLGGSCFFFFFFFWQYWGGYSLVLTWIFTLAVVGINSVFVIGWILSSCGVQAHAY